MSKSLHHLKVLVAPLDWGLGHATRCIPIIKGLRDAGATVLIGAENAQKSLLEQEFPQIKTLHLPGYRVSYSKGKSGFLWKLASQLPKILTRIYEEHRWLLQVVEQEKINLIISDNRYGLWHPTIRSIFITHQLQVALPFAWAERLVQRRLYRWVNRYSECWVPDMVNGIAGKLSHPARLPIIPVRYINFLSRFEKIEAEKKYKYCFLLSGPEPQRSIFEEKIVTVTEKIHEPVVIVRGILKDDRPLTIDHGSSIVHRPSSVIPSEGRNVYDHLPTKQLAELVQQSEYIICRGGYTSLMELLALRKKLVVVPTPGQTEQEYLAETLTEKGLAVSINQASFCADFFDTIDQCTFKVFDIVSFNTSDVLTLLSSPKHDR